MGCVTFGAPRAIIQRVKDEFDLQTFVETGTHLGETSAWASGVFKQVFTIEASEDYHREARQRHAALANVVFLLGDSRTCLAETVAHLSSPALFWLDAHWMGAGTLPQAVVYGQTGECPVLQEIEIINASPLNHFIFIDDARLFLAPPPRPHRAADWPDIATLLASLNTPAPRYTVVYDDVIGSIPLANRPQVEAIFQDMVTAGPPVSPVSGSFLRKITRRLGIG